MIDMPDGSIKRCDIFYTGYVKLERSPSRFLPVFHAVVRSAIDPLDDAPTFDVVDADETVATKGDTPVDGPPDVRAEKRPIPADHRVFRGRQPSPTERRPEQCRRRK